MHVAQPMIVLWFLRRWRRIALSLAIYDVGLIAAILLLEQHYVVDILAGFLVAGVAIVITGGPFGHPDEPSDPGTG
jgi:membrane-associated phospholipid phosphatase